MDILTEGQPETACWRYPGGKEIYVYEGIERSRPGRATHSFFHWVVHRPGAGVDAAGVKPEADTRWHSLDETWLWPGHDVQQF